MKGNQFFYFISLLSLGIQFCGDEAMVSDETTAEDSHLTGEEIDATTISITGQLATESASALTSFGVTYTLSDLQLNCLAIDDVEEPLVSANIEGDGTFNLEDIPNSPLECEIVDASDDVKAKMYFPQETATDVAGDLTTVEELDPTLAFIDSVNLGEIKIDFDAGIARIQPDRIKPLRGDSSRDYRKLMANARASKESFEFDLTGTWQVQDLPDRIKDKLKDKIPVQTESCMNGVCPSFYVKRLKGKAKSNHPNFPDQGFDGIQVWGTHTDDTTSGKKAFEACGMKTGFGREEYFEFEGDVKAGKFTWSEQISRNDSAITLDTYSDDFFAANQNIKILFDNSKDCSRENDQLRCFMEHYYQEASKDSSHCLPEYRFVPKNPTNVQEGITVIPDRPLNLKFTGVGKFLNSKTFASNRRGPLQLWTSTEGPFDGHTNFSTQLPSGLSACPIQPMERVTMRLVGTDQVRVQIEHGHRVAPMDDANQRKSCRKFLRERLKEVYQMDPESKKRERSQMLLKRVDN